MSGPKILNIDAFAEPSRELLKGGIAYPIKPVDLRQFIENLDLAEELEKKGEETPRKRLEQAITAIKKSIPTLPHDELMSFGPGQLAIALAFINGDFDEAAIKNGLVSAAHEADAAAATGEKKVT